MTVKADEYIRIDRTRQLGDEPETGHNRWHPDIKPAAEVDPGQIVGMEIAGCL